jgi:hypothetical protein
MPLKVVSVFGHASVAITGDLYGHVSIADVGRRHATVQQRRPDVPHDGSGPHVKTWTSFGRGMSVKSIKPWRERVSPTSTLSYQV